MDLGIIRGLGTVVLFLSFVALVVWAWSPAQRSRFDAASRLPLADEDSGEGQNGAQGDRNGAPGNQS